MTRHTALLAVVMVGGCSFDAPEAADATLDLRSALLLRTRDHLAICVEVDPALAGADRIVARVEADVAWLAASHRAWAQSGLARGPLEVVLGCPGAVAIDRAVDPKGAGGAVAGPPSPYRLHVHVLGDARAAAVLGTRPHARAIAELVAVDDHRVAEVSTSLIAHAAALGTAELREVALPDALGLPVLRAEVVPAATSCGIPAVDYVVNGHVLNDVERQWVRYIAEHVVDQLQGDLPARLRVAARSAWWSLKEGVLDLANPVVYSNCHFATGDARIGPLEVCPDPTSPWQVGVAAVQVPNHADADVLAVAQALFPDRTTTALLGETAVEAGFPVGTATWQAIASSTGRLRRSWLLRTTAIGVTLIEPEIAWECITNAFFWCYGTGWPTSAAYAPDRAGAFRAIADLEALLERLR